MQAADVEGMSQQVPVGQLLGSGMTLQQREMHPE